MTHDSQANITSTRMTRGFSGGLSLLVAVALAVAVGSGTETARRVATTGAGLVSSLVCDRTSSISPAELASSETPRVHAAGAMRSQQNPPLVNGSGEVLRPELLDLPPPLA